MQMTKWEKDIYEIQVVKKLISRSYKVQLLQISVKKTDNPIRSWKKDLNRYLTNDHSDANNCNYLKSTFNQLI
jgi:hypothetical protein